MHKYNRYSKILEKFNLFLQNVNDILINWETNENYNDFKDRLLDLMEKQKFNEYFSSLNESTRMLLNEIINTKLYGYGRKKINDKTLLVYLVDRINNQIIDNIRWEINYNINDEIDCEIDKQIQLKNELNLFLLKYGTI